MTEKIETYSQEHPQEQPEGMAVGEKKAVFSLAGIYALRMMGLFMILPVFSLYADRLEGATPTLIGLAIGVYGLTQALLQIPYGMVSDRIGRKPVIITGLLIFALGSAVAAMADSIAVVILGRALQGAGAIAATVMALTADLTREENRVKAMTIIGTSIGMAFSMSLVLGPILNHWIGVDGIFWLTAILSLSAVAFVKWVVPNPVSSSFHRDAMTAPEQIRNVLRNGQLLRLNYGVFTLHLMLTATFVVVPLALRDQAALETAKHWEVYFPVMLVSLMVMVPFVIIAEKKRRLKQVFGAAIMTLAVAQVAFMMEHNSLAGIVFALFMFFIAFNVLEATLPSLVAKTCPPDQKGTAMGMFSSSQFMGAFFGGVCGGWIHGQYGIQAVFGFCAAIAVIWFMVAATMQSPRYLSSHLIKVGQVDEKRARQLVAELTRVTGVAEAIVVVDDGVAYLKVILIGNLGADPEVKYMPSGDAITTLSVATSESWKDKNTGEQVEKTEWHRVVLFKRLAEIAGEYLKKGSKVYIEGRLQTRKWQGQDGQDRYTTEIVANDLQMLDSRGGGTGNFNQAPARSNEQPQAASASAGGSFDDFDDDIPF